MSNFPRVPFLWLRSVALLVLPLFASFASAQTVVTLQNATASYSQSGFPIGKTIDGITNDDLGWAIDPQFGVTTTAAFETASDLGFGGGTQLNFTVNTGVTFLGGLTVGRFRLSFTTDNRATFADGLANGGDVTANWTVLSLTSLVSSGGATLTVQGDDSVLASGTRPNTDVYTFTAFLNATGVTGFRLEALGDASLPAMGPGRYDNGNFVLSEFALTATAVPEPATYAALAGLGALALALRRRRAR